MLLGELAKALNSDDDRRRILVVELAHLPDTAPPDVDGARKSALVEAVGHVLEEREPALDDRRGRLIAAAIVEAVRSREVGERDLSAEILLDLWHGIGGRRRDPADPAALAA